MLRTGCQWKALDATGICSGSTAHLRFQEWAAAGVFLELWRVGLERYDEVKGLDWSWLSWDGAMTKSPLGGEKTGANPTDRGKSGVKRSLLTEAQGIPVGLAVDRANRHDMKLVRATVDTSPRHAPRPAQIIPRAGSFGCHCEERSDVAISLRLSTCRGTIIARGCRQKSLLQIITARSWQMAKYDAVLLA